MTGERTDGVGIDRDSVAIKGSITLVAGRVIGMLLSLGIQVVLLRALTRTEYGAFGYALSVVSIATVLVGLGTAGAVPRFLGMYDEQEDERRFAGTLVFEVLLVGALGLAVFVAILGVRALAGDQLIDDPLALSLTLILVLNAPIESFDRILEAVAAVAGDTRTIFIRKYLLEPGLRLAAVVLLIAVSGSPQFLAVAYVAAGLIGTALYVSVVGRRLRDRGVLSRIRRGDVTSPGPELLRYAVPLLAHTLLAALMPGLAAVLLGSLHGVDEVAPFRAAFSFGRLNQVVGWTFAVMYLPLAGRYFARRDSEGMAHVYWRSASWTLVLTLPIFLITGVFSAASGPTLFGDGYDDGVGVLTVLALAYYANQAVGFNIATLQAFGQLAWSLAVDAVAFVVFLVGALVLIPPFEALGGAFAVLAGLLTVNVGGQLGLRRLGIPMFAASARSIYALVAVAIGVALLVSLADPGIVVAVVVSGLLSLVVVALAGPRLELTALMPGLARLPVVGRVLDR